MRGRSALATRLVFLCAGFCMAGWAPLVPFAKARLGVQDGTLGVLLLCLGIGSVVAMQGAGVASARLGARPAIVCGGVGMALVLPFLTVASTPWTLGASLFLFGGALGSLDAAMNVHAVEVERRSGRTLMSGFHALFSVGGFAGAALMTGLLSAGLPPLPCTLLFAAITLAAMAAATPRLLRGRQDAGDGEPGPLLIFPRGIVLLLAALAAITFLVEGAMLDWGALLITGRGLVPESRGGLGYMLFSVAMTAGRLFGDRLTARRGDRFALRAGGMVALAGFALLLLGPGASSALPGFVLIGLGAANMVPVLFRKAGAQHVMPVSLAVSAVTTVGYAGVLMGPAAVGGVAHLLGLPAAFVLLAALLAVVPLLAGVVDRIGRAPVFTDPDRVRF